jgi:hypothetical protein
MLAVVSENMISVCRGRMRPGVKGEFRAGGGRVQPLRQRDPAHARLDPHAGTVA